MRKDHRALIAATAAIAQIASVWLVPTLELGRRHVAWPQTAPFAIPALLPRP